MPISTGLQKMLELQDKEMGKPMTVNQSKSYAYFTECFTKVKNDRALQSRLLNDMTFIDDYQANDDIRNSYLRPVSNPDEVRINTGTVEKKVLLVVNEILNLNMTHDIFCFDKDDRELTELGDDFGDIITRTNEQEKSDDIDFMRLWEMLTQRIMYTEEYWEYRVVDDKNASYGKHIISRPRRRFVDSRKVFPGDITIPWYRWDENPFIVKYDRCNYKLGESLFGKWPNWKYVQPGVAQDSSWYNGLYDWRMSNTLSGNELEIITYDSYPDDEKQIRINGVDMLPYGTSRKQVMPGYMLRPHCYRAMSDTYIYGQLFPVNAKILGAFKDDILRSIVRKFRQGVEPPIAIKGKKTLTRDMFEAGAVTNGLSADEISQLVTHKGITPADISAIDIIAKQIEEDIGVSRANMGIPDKKQSATSTIEQQKQFIKSIGLAVFSWAAVKRDDAYLRIFNVLENINRPIDVTSMYGKKVNVYQSYTVKNADMENDRKGTKVIHFVDEPLSDADLKYIRKMEEEEEAVGNPVRYKFINVKELRNVLLHWYAVITPQEKDSSALQKVMLKDEIEQATAVAEATQSQLNPDTWQQRFERRWKVKNAFSKPAPQDQQDPNNPNAQTAPGTEPSASSEENKAKAGDMLKKIKQTKNGAQMQKGLKASGNPNRPGVKTIANEMK